MTSRSILAVATLALLAGISIGCADTSWESARRANTVVAYHQFLRDHPGSPHVEEARERLAYLRIETRPSIPNFEEFEKNHPQSALLDVLRAEVEPLYLERARARNTPEAYREFLSRYPDTTLSGRARGNLAYVERIAWSANRVALERFVREHPDSDFTAEVQRTLDLLESRTTTAIRRLAVRVDVSPNVAQPERVRRGFAAVVSRAYRPLGVAVTPIPQRETIPDGFDAWVQVDYEEVPAEGTFGGQTFVSRARMRLFHLSEPTPVWDWTFDAPAEHLSSKGNRSDKTLFGNSRFEFWDEFFVPLSTWATSRSRVQRREYMEAVVAIDVRGDRAAVLLASGGIEYLDVSSPIDPEFLQRYRREHDLTRWVGLHLLSDERVMLFGEDGVEIVRFTTHKPRRLARWEASDVGSVKAAAVYGQTALFAGTGGLFAVRLASDTLAPHRLYEANLVGVAVQEPNIYLVAPTRVEIATPKQLLRRLTGSRVALGEQFGAFKARLAGNALWVFGETRVAKLSLANPVKPVPVAVLEHDELGQVNDLIADGSYLYLLGARGLQVTDPLGRGIWDFIQVEAADAMARKGRFLLIGGRKTLEVVDVSAYRVAAASPAD
jgi:hypothetical protein